MDHGSCSVLLVSCREPRGAYSSLLVADYALLRIMMLLIWVAYSYWFSGLHYFRSCDLPGECSICWWQSNVSALNEVYRLAIHYYSNKSLVVLRFIVLLVLLLIIINSRTRNVCNCAHAADCMDVNSRVFDLSVVARICLIVVRPCWRQ